MSISTKYGRTFHYPCSPGTTSDDRINHEWIDDIMNIDTVIDLEKMDGENGGITPLGVFARSHAAPTTNPWASFLKPKWELIKKDLEGMEIEIFGENLFAIHSILYPELDSHYKVFAIRQKDMWLGWEEVKWFASCFDLDTVPEIRTYSPKESTPKEIETFIIENSNEPSAFGSLQYDYKAVKEGGILLPCSKEGIVTRNFNEFPVDKFKENVFKYVRKDHVKTDEHWSRNWKRASLISERKIEKIKEENDGI